MRLVAESVLNSLSYNDQVVLSENNNIVVAEKPGGDLSVGSAPPDFTLTDIRGNSFNLSGIQGKVVMLDFWEPGANHV